MPAKAQTSMQVVRKEDKELRLRRFVESSLEMLGADDMGAVNEILLLARSLESPALKAVVSLAPEIAARGLMLRAIVLMAELPGDRVSGAALDLGPLDAAFRHARNPRLIDAHEQLVLSPTAVWIGDCMRRDPAKRDAFELYATQGDASALWAARSFARLWQHGEPIDIRSPALALDAAPIADGLAQVAAAAATEAGATSVLTRH